MNTESRIRHTYRYRNDLRVKTLEDAIGHVLAHVQAATGHLPAMIIVPQSQLAEGQRVVALVTQAFAKRGRVVDIAVVPVGGCLVGEVWWQDGQ